MFTCLSSILDNQIRKQVCQAAFEMTKPGGSIIVYDFVVNNPKNRDVKSVSLSELKTYFSNCEYISKKTEVLPPLARKVGKFSTRLCMFLELLPLIKTHRVTMFIKPG
jgi:hypothetical protein